MGQAQIYEPQETEIAEFLITCGFRWCKKDKRWEKNTRNPQKFLDPVLSKYPNIKTGSKNDS